MVKTGSLDCGRIPIVVQPQSDGADLGSWAGQNRDWIEANLIRSGAILFRGFGVDNPGHFSQVVDAIAGESLEYRERSSPRSKILGNIYTSTDYPASYEIFLHNESSYSHTWPRKLLFCCEIPAETGGETPIADSRRIYLRISPQVRQQFAARKVMYVRNFGTGLGLLWQTAFQTEDKARVADYCHAAGMEHEWLDGDRLRTRHVRPAIQAHPKTGETVWFNHAAFFHVTTLDPVVRDTLLASYAEDELPNNSYYGDGMPIEDSVLNEIREAYAAETVKFPWQQGDVMLLDNMLTCHGRSPYAGLRRTLVAMAQPVTDEALAAAAAT